VNRLLIIVIAALLTQGCEFAIEYQRARDYEIEKARLHHLVWTVLYPHYQN